jgi:uncharacterized protein YlxW (UPF0749 family)
MATVSTETHEYSHEKLAFALRLCQASYDVKEARLKKEVEKMAFALKLCQASFNARDARMKRETWKLAFALKLCQASFTARNTLAERQAAKMAFALRLANASYKARDARSKMEVDSLSKVTKNLRYTVFLIQASYNELKAKVKIINDFALKH